MVWLVPATKFSPQLRLNRIWSCSRAIDFIVFQTNLFPVKTFNSFTTHFADIQGCTLIISVTISRLLGWFRSLLLSNLFLKPENSNKRLIIDKTTMIYSRLPLIPIVFYSSTDFFSFSRTFSFSQTFLKTRCLILLSLFPPSTIAVLCLPTQVSTAILSTSDLEEPVRDSKSSVPFYPGPTDIHWILPSKTRLNAIISDLIIIALRLWGVNPSLYWTSRPTTATSSIALISRGVTPAISAIHLFLSPTISVSASVVLPLAS